MKRLAAIFATLLCLLTPAAAYAAGYNPVGDACTANGNKSTACTAKDPIVGTQGILQKAATIVAWIAGIAAVIVIVVSGFMFVTAGGDAGKVASARNALIGALVGLVIVVMARAIIYLVLNKVK